MAVKAKHRAGLGLHGNGLCTVCHGWGLPPAHTLQAAALPWPLWCPLSLRQGQARCLMLIAVHVRLLKLLLLGVAGWSISIIAACICDCHALLPVLVLLLLQAALVPASTKAQEHDEHGS